MLQLTREYIHGIPHQTLTDSTVNNGIFVQKMVLEPTKSTDIHQWKLRKLECTLNSSFFYDIFSKYMEMHGSPDISLQNLQFEILPGLRLCVLNTVKDAHYACISCWQMHAVQSGVAINPLQNIAFSLTRLTCFGEVPEHPLDDFLTRIDSAFQNRQAAAFRKASPVVPKLYQTHIHTKLLFYILRAIFRQLCTKIPKIPTSAILTIYSRHHKLYINLDTHSRECPIPHENPGLYLHLTQTQILPGFSPCVKALHTKKQQLNTPASKFIGNSSVNITYKNISSSIQAYSQKAKVLHERICISAPTVEVYSTKPVYHLPRRQKGRLFFLQYFLNHIRQLPDNPQPVFSRMLEECGKFFTLLSRIAILYILTSSDADLTMLYEQMIPTARECYDRYPGNALIISILTKIYKQQQHPLLLADILKDYSKTEFHSVQEEARIRLHLAKIMVTDLKDVEGALQQLKPLRRSLAYISTDNLIEFADILAVARSAKAACSFLQSAIRLRKKNTESIILSKHIIDILSGGKASSRSLIKASRLALRYDPQHLQTRFIYADALFQESRWRPAATQYHQIIQILETDSVSPEEKRKLILKCFDRLEFIYGSLNKTHQLLSIYKLHLSYDQKNLDIFQKLVALLESANAFADVVYTCQRFLNRNPELRNDIRAGIYLAINNAAVKANLPQKAQQAIRNAEKIAPNHPNVLISKLNTARQKNNLKRQEELLKQLIQLSHGADSLPFILQLAQLYFDVLEDTDAAIRQLRKATAIAPNNRNVLLELRRVLRKNAQNFELVSVLEKLARLTTSIQNKKSFLLEAAELHQQLGNIQLSQKLSNEAHLLTPINPESPVPLAGRSPSFQLPIKTTFSNLPQANLASDIAQLQTLTSVELIESAIHTAASTSSQHLLAAADSHANGTVMPERDDNHQSEDSIDFDIDISLDLSASIPINSINIPVPKKATEPSDSPDIKRDDAETSSELPIEQQIILARTGNDPNKLIDKLKCAIDSYTDPRDKARKYLEIACIQTYELNLYQEALAHVNKAITSDPTLARAEQTLNVLELIYQNLKAYNELAEIYTIKHMRADSQEDRIKYELLIAQINFEHLNNEEAAIETLEGLIKLKPDNEKALLLLSQLYANQHNYEKAYQTASKVDGCFEPLSKADANHKLRMAQYLTEIKRFDEAKAIYMQLLINYESTDKLNIIERYKQICRNNDEWPELLSILKLELALYLKLNVNDFDIYQLKPEQFQEQQSTTAAHILREYADILFYKLENTQSAATLFQLLAEIAPDDSYAKEVLQDITSLSDKAPENLGQSLLKWCEPFIPQTNPEEKLTINDVKKALLDAHENAFLKLLLAHLLAEHHQSESSQNILLALAMQLHSLPNANTIASYILEILKSPHFDRDSRIYKNIRSKCCTFMKS